MKHHPRLSWKTGIVTKFTVKAHPIGKVWGGIRIYDASQTDKIFKTLHDFVPGSNKDTKAAIIVTNISAVASLNAFLIFYFYDGEAPPTEGPFADFLTIPSLVSITGTQSYPDLASTKSMNALRFGSNVFCSSNLTEWARLSLILEYPSEYGSH
jgi:hypothetical protein